MVNTTKIRVCMAGFKHSQQDLADILNISKVSVNHKLNGKSSFTIDELNALAKLYKKKLSFFFN